MIKRYYIFNYGSHYFGRGKYFLDSRVNSFKYTFFLILAEIKLLPHRIK
jgi:hypothetical protein